MRHWALVYLFSLCAFSEAAAAGPTTLTIHPTGGNVGVVLSEDPRMSVTMADLDFISDDVLRHSAQIREAAHVRLVKEVAKEGSGYCATYVIEESGMEPLVCFRCALRNKTAEGVRMLVMEVKGLQSVAEAAMKMPSRLAELEKYSGKKDPLVTLMPGIQLHVPATWQRLRNGNKPTFHHVASDTVVSFMPLPKQADADRLEAAERKEGTKVEFNLMPRGRLTKKKTSDGFFNTSFWTCATSPCLSVLVGAHHHLSATNAFHMFASRLVLSGDGVEKDSSHAASPAWKEGPENLIWFSNRQQFSPRSDRDWERYLSNIEIRGNVSGGSSYRSSGRYDGGRGEGRSVSQMKGTESFALCGNRNGVWVRRAVSKTVVGSGSYSALSTTRDDDDLHGRWSVERGQLVIRGQRKTRAWPLRALALGKIQINGLTFGTFRTSLCPPDYEEEALR